MHRGQGRRPYRGRDGRYATRSWKKQGSILPQSLQRELGPAATISDLWAPEVVREYIPVVLSPAVRGHLLQQLLQHTNALGDPLCECVLGDGGEIPVYQPRGASGLMVFFTLGSPKEI